MNIHQQVRNMKKTVFLTLLIMISGMACTGPPSEIPLGTWEYDLYVNGVKAGKAVTSLTREKGLYITESRMEMNAGTIKNTSMNRVVWSKHKFESKLVNPANKRKYNVIIVGSGLAGGAAAASLAELGYTRTSAGSMGSVLKYSFR